MRNKTLWTLELWHIWIPYNYETMREYKLHKLCYSNATGRSCAMNKMDKRILLSNQCLNTIDMARHDGSTIICLQKQFFFYIRILTKCIFDNLWYCCGISVNTYIHKSFSLLNSHIFFTIKFINDNILGRQTIEQRTV